LDVAAYCGYKFVGIVLTVLAGMIFGYYAFYAFLILTGLCMAVFMVRTMKLVFPEIPSYNMGGSNRRNYFLFSIAILQFLEFYYLSIT